MKKIIDRSVYDTEKASEIATWSSHHLANDFGFYSETLYRTEKGNCFLHGHGGPASPYSEPAGNNGMTGGEDIRALSDDEALEWLAGHGFVDEAEKLFGDALEEA